MTFKFYKTRLQTRSKTIKQHQARWPNGEMFGHQTIMLMIGLVAKHFSFGQALKPPGIKQGAQETESLWEVRQN